MTANFYYLPDLTLIIPGSSIRGELKSSKLGELGCGRHEIPLEPYTTGYPPPYREKKIKKMIAQNFYEPRLR